MSEILFDHLMFYKKFLMAQWYQMGPREYITLLSTVAVVGYIAMRGAGRK